MSANFNTCFQSWTQVGVFAPANLTLQWYSIQGEEETFLVASCH